MGTTFLRGSVLRTSNFLGTGVLLVSGLTSAAADCGVATAFTTGTLGVLLTPGCSLLVRLDLPEVDLGLAISDTPSITKFRNEWYWSHIHLCPATIKRTLELSCKS